MVIRVPPFDHPKVTRHNGRSMDRLPDVMVDDHKLTGSCFQDADGDLRDQARKRPRPPARPAVQRTCSFTASMTVANSSASNGWPGCWPGTGGPPPIGAADLVAVLATCHRPRRRGRGVESDQVALERGRVDAVIAGLLFMAGMRRSEVSALRWADIADSTDGDSMLVTVRRSKTNPASTFNAADNVVVPCRTTRTRVSLPG